MKSFFKWISASPAAMRYVMITVVIAMFYFVLQKMHHRDGVADFRVYYDAAHAYLNNEPMYGVPFGIGSGFYKYSPIAVYPFIPFTFLPYPIAGGIYYFLILASFILFSLVLVYYLENQFHFSGENRGWSLVLITLFLADHFERELHLGNVNVLLLILSFLVFRMMMKGRHLMAGVIFAFILLYKPHFIILLPYFLWNRQFKLLMVSVFAAVTCLIIPGIFKGWSFNITLIEQWIFTIREHNIVLDHSPNTIYGMYNEFVLAPLNLQTNLTIVPVLLAVVAVLFAWFLIYNRRNFVPQGPEFVEYFTLVALIPCLAHTDTEHFMWTWPLIALSILILFYRSIQRKGIYIAVLALAFIPYCLNSPDIVGRELMLLFDESGFLGLANLVIIVITILLYFKSSRPESKKMAVNS